jgi:dTDP-4-dehydrorhamnose reductase
MAKKRALITGGSGLLGSNIVRAIAKDFQVFATYNSNYSLIPGCNFCPLDIRDNNNVFSVFQDINPHLVVHAAALAKVDYCEDHQEEAWAINVEGTENIAKASRDVRAKLVYISTDSIFDGKKGMYSEEDTPSPVNVYARTKLEGEKRVQRMNPDNIIIRTAFYGWSLHNKTSLAEWVVTSLRDRKTINMFNDVFFSPIFTGDLIEIIVKMYHKEIRGVYHVGGRERCSKYAFGLQIAESFGLNVDNIHSSSIASVGLRTPRPRDISLNIAKISRDLDAKMPSVKEGVEHFRSL